ncbi:MAG: MFS transporter [Alphaproteobacteria bacterium]|nr:MFS transporter [Alphaproteobacteria bacterium]
MAKTQFGLLKTKRFLPLFLTQFLGAFHDNLFKSAMVALLLFNTAGGLVEADDETKILVTLATPVFIIPFVFFSALAGQITDKYPKQIVLQRNKMIELVIACLGAAAILSNSLVLQFLTLFGLGVQSAFFGPGKYSILPQHLAEEELIGGNAMIGISTFMAILLGTIVGMGLINVPYGVWIIAGVILSSSIAGYLTSLKIPDAPPEDDVMLDYNIFTQTYRMVADVLISQRSILFSALAIGWFWFMGSLIVGQLPNFTRLILGANEHVSALFMVLFSIAIGLGGLINEVLLKGKISTKYCPIAAVGVSVFTIDLCFAGYSFADTYNPKELMSIAVFMEKPMAWRILFDLFMLCTSAGMFVVPFNAIFQRDVDSKRRSRFMAGLSIMNSALIMTSSLMAAGLFALGVSITAIFIGLAIINLLIAMWFFRHKLS